MALIGGKMLSLGRGRKKLFLRKEKVAIRNILDNRVANRKESFNTMTTLGHVKGLLKSYVHHLKGIVLLLLILG